MINLGQVTVFLTANLQGLQAGLASAQTQLAGFQTSVGTAQTKAATAMGKVNGALKSMETGLRHVSQSTRIQGFTMTAIGATGVAAFKGLINIGGQYEKGINGISNALSGAAMSHEEQVVRAKELGELARRLSRELGVDIKEILDAMNTSIQDGYDSAVKAQEDLIRNAYKLKMTDPGMTAELKDAIGLITRLQNILKSRQSQPNFVEDITRWAHAAVNAGRMTVQEFERDVAKYAVLGEAVGADIESQFVHIASLSRIMKPEAAADFYKDLIKGLYKQSVGAAKTIKAMGIDFNVKTAKAYGDRGEFYKFFQHIDDQVRERLTPGMAGFTNEMERLKQVMRDNQKSSKDWSAETEKALAQGVEDVRDMDLALRKLFDAGFNAGKGKKGEENLWENMSASLVEYSNKYQNAQKLFNKTVVQGSPEDIAKAEEVRDQAREAMFRYQKRILEAGGGTSEEMTRLLNAQKRVQEEEKKSLKTAEMYKSAWEGVHAEVTATGMTLNKDGKKAEEQMKLLIQLQADQMLPKHLQNPGLMLQARMGLLSSITSGRGNAVIAFLDLVGNKGESVNQIMKEMSDSVAKALLDKKYADAMSTVTKETDKLAAEVKDLIYEIYKISGPEIIQFIRDLVQGVKDLHAWVVKNPELVKQLTMAFIKLSAVLVALGPVLIVMSVMSDALILLISLGRGIAWLSSMIWALGGHLATLWRYIYTGIWWLVTNTFARLVPWLTTVFWPALQRVGYFLLYNLGRILVFGIEWVVAAMGTFFTWAAGAVAAAAAALGLPIWGFVALVVAVLAAIALLIYNWDVVGPWLADIYEMGIQGATEFFLLTGALLDQWTLGFRTKISEIHESLVSTFANLLVFLSNWFSSAYETAIQWVTQALLDIQAGFTGFFTWLSDHMEPWKFLFQGAGAQIGNFAGSMAHFAQGGYVGGGSRTQGDIIPAMLTPGEYVLTPDETDRLANLGALLTGGWQRAMVGQIGRDGASRAGRGGGEAVAGDTTVNFTGPVIVNDKSHAQELGRTLARRIQLRTP